MGVGASGPDGARLGVPRVKTTVPRLSPAYLRRSRLSAVLDAAAPGQVVLVSAPAGYGKTLLLAEWAARHPERTCWLSLDETDNDDRRFWSAVLAAVAACPALPAGHELAALPVPARPSHDPDFLAAVVGVLDTAAVAVRLVLDDVHELVAADP